MNWIQTYSGKVFDYRNPKPGAVRIQDMAHALSLLNRFSGHTRVPYSVAQHCIYVSQHVPPSLALAGLLHDVHEAFVIDLPSPLKAMVPDYRKVEEGVQGFVLATLGVSPEEVHGEEVKGADRRMLATEARDLLARPERLWDDPPEPYPCVVVPWDWQLAKRRFLETYRKLMAGKRVPVCRVCTEEG